MFVQTNTDDKDNSRPEVGVEHRELSPIIGLKKFNNWIKSVLIGKFAFRGHNRPGANVLDLGCGKGGDLNKWKQARIRLYVGMGEWDSVVKLHAYARHCGDVDRSSARTVSKNVQTRFRRPLFCVRLLLCEL